MLPRTLRQGSAARCYAALRGPEELPAFASEADREFQEASRGAQDGSRTRIFFLDREALSPLSYLSNGCDDRNRTDASPRGRQGHNLERRASSRLDHHERWSPERESNPLPLDYETSAHPHVRSGPGGESGGRTHKAGCARPFSKRVPSPAVGLSLLGRGTGIRTQDSRGKNPQLCQLSYTPASVPPVGVEPTSPKATGSEPAAFSSFAREAGNAWRLGGAGRDRTADALDFTQPLFRTELPHHS